MKRASKEEYIQSDRESRVTRNSKLDILQMDKILNQMQTTYRANIQAQQCYIDILKRKNKNINSTYIKSIYALFTNNKANQICFQKEQHAFINAQIDDKLLRRYYARLIQMGIRRVSYFWMNFASLEFLASYIVKFTRSIQSLFNDSHKLKTLDHHFTVMKMLYHENAILEQKIYQLLIDEGYLMSMDQFYRINGVDLVGDQQYEGHAAKIQTPSVQPSQQQIQSKKDSSIAINITTPRQKQWKKWGYSRVSSDRIAAVVQPQTEKSKTKIKNMLQSMVTILKSSIEQQQTPNKLQIIEQQNYGNPKSQRDNIEPFEDFVPKISNYRKRISKPENILPPQIKKKVNQKKLSIELVSYFSNQMRSVISQVQAIDIDCLSELLMASESNSNQNRIINMNKSEEPYIHSLKSLQSLNRIKEQKKRGKLIQMALKKQNIQSLSQMYDDFFDSYSNFNCRKSSLKQKISFRSAPGMYISVAKNRQCAMKVSSKSSKDQKQNRKRLIIRQAYTKDYIFQNELIVNELAARQAINLANKVNFTEVNGSNLKTGIVSQNLMLFNNKYSNFKTENPRQLNMRQHFSLDRNKENEYKMDIIQFIKQNASAGAGQQLKSKKVKIISDLAQIGNNVQRKQNVIRQKQIQKSKQKYSIVHQIRSLSTNGAKNKENSTSEALNYTIYDRVRRKIIIAK